MNSTQRLVVLDRDGVINEDSEGFIKSPAEWQAIDGSLEAIAALNRARFTVVVATNQSGIGRGLYNHADLRDIHGHMQQELAALGGVLDCIYVCPHHPEAGCDCRKPAPGMLRQIEQDYGLSLDNLPVVGDSERDLLAAQAVGARPILVLTGNGRHTRSQVSGDLECFDDLAAVAQFLIDEIEPG